MICEMNYRMWKNVAKIHLNCLYKFNWERIRIIIYVTCVSHLQFNVLFILVGRAASTVCVHHPH